MFAAKFTFSIDNINFSRESMFETMNSSLASWQSKMRSDCTSHTMFIFELAIFQDVVHVNIPSNLVRRTSNSSSLTWLIPACRL
jgi:hypothetical protein